MNKVILKWKQLKELKLSDAFHYINFGEVLSKSMQIYCTSIYEKVCKHMDSPSLPKSESKKSSKFANLNDNLIDSTMIRKDLAITINNITFLIHSFDDLEEEVIEAMNLSENNNEIIQISWSQALLPAKTELNSTSDKLLNSLATSTKEVLPLFIASDLQNDFKAAFSNVESSNKIVEPFLFSIF